MNKILLWLSVAILLGATISIYFFYQNEPAELEEQATLSAIPENSSFFIKFNSFKKVIKELERPVPMLSDLAAIPFIGQFKTQLKRIDSLLQSHPEELQISTNFDFWLSGMLAGNKEYHLCFYSDEFTKKQYKLLLNELSQSQAKEPLIYDQVSIHEISLNKQQAKPWFLTHYKGILILSSHAHPVESAIVQLNAESKMSNQADFIKILATANQHAMANIYLNHKHLKSFYSHFLNDEPPMIQAVDHFCTWTEYDLVLTDQELFLNGFSLSGTKDLTTMQPWLKQQAGKISLLETVPANHLSHSIYQVQDPVSFQHKKKNGAHNDQYIRNRDKLLNQWEKQSKYKLDQFFYELMDQEFGLIQPEINQSRKTKANVLVIDMLSQSATQEKLNDLYKNIASHSKVKAKQLSFDFRLDESTHFNLYQFPFPELAEVLFGTQFNGLKSNWMCLYHDHLIFTAEKKELEHYLSELFRGNTALKDVVYQDFSENLSDKCNLSHYLNLRQFSSELNQLFNKEYQINEETEEVISHFQAISIQVGTSKKPQMISNDIYIKYNPDIKQKPRTIWELALDTIIHTKPALVENHNNSQREILVQDINHKLYLVNHAGRILWEKQLNNRILSEIHQIDYYKNNKLQYLFNTKSRIHLLDRNGNNVERYPINLHSHATNGLGLADYDNNKDYRIFIASEDLSVNLYDIDGNMVKGWKFDETENKVTQPVQHIRVRDKDYLVFTDNNRIYFMNRRGKERVEPDQQFTPSSNPIYLYQSSKKDQSHIVATDKKGTIHTVYFNEKVETRQLGEFSEDHFFLSKDLNADGLQDYIFADGNELSVYQANGDLMLKKTFSNKITQLPTYYEFPGNIKKLGIVCGESNQIFLINSDGSLHKGFPLAGNTSFSIGSLQASSRFKLFVGSQEEFLYQYDVK